MNFDLSDEQIMLQDSISRFLDAELSDTRLLDIVSSPDGHDPSLWTALAELGIFGILVPEAYGGLGLKMLDLAAAAEVLGAKAMPGPFLGHCLATFAIVQGGSETQKEYWLPRLASGESIGTVAFGEEDNRWQPDEWAMQGGQHLSGKKHNVLYAEQANVMVVGLAGGKLALVDCDQATLQIESLNSLDGTRRLHHVIFDEIAAEPLNATGRSVSDAGLILLAADAFGGAQRCLNMAVEYAQTREQFGQVIAKFQALKHQLANIALDVEPSRGLYWYAAYAFDDIAEEAERMAAIAKAHICDRFVQAARDATEAHGGIAYTWEYPLHIWLKRAMFNRNYLGAPTVHRQRSAELGHWVA